MAESFKTAGELHDRKKASRPQLKDPRRALRLRRASRPQESFKTEGELKDFWRASRPQGGFKTAGKIQDSVDLQDRRRASRQQGSLKTSGELQDRSFLTTWEEVVRAITTEEFAVAFHRWYFLKKKDKDRREVKGRRRWFGDEILFN